ncbi:MAG: hypothetical protein SCI25_01250 [Desulfuromonadales bacterium]|nr:hypothetical protein [Desulfuromonadales bacterium]MDW7756789.1 hypothetical protein [Desulfuromonadales bacterium]
MIRRTYLGLDLHAGQIAAVALRRQGKGSLLTGSATSPLPMDILKPSLRDPNILDPGAFQNKIRQALGPLAGREDRIALSLPEGSGRLLLTDTDTAFASHEEGRDILRWQLKAQFPADPKEIQLDYQVVGKTEGGRYRLAVAFATQRVLSQYEEVLSQIGFNPAHIDFHTLNLYNYYRPRIDLGEDFFLVAIEENSLSLQFFQGHHLGFHRSRDIEPSTEALFQELLRTLVGCAKDFPKSSRAAVYLHTNWPNRDELSDPLRSAFGREPIHLDPHIDRMGSVSALIRPQDLAAAIGAAERMM